MNAKYNLTIPQNNIWLVENFYDDKSINILAGTFTIKTGFNIELAKKTVNKFFELNDAARLKFIKDGSSLYQYVEEYKPFDVITKDISGLTEKQCMKLKNDPIQSIYYKQYFLRYQFVFHQIHSYFNIFSFYLKLILKQKEISIEILHFQCFMTSFLILLYKKFLFNKIQYEIFNNKKARSVCSFGGFDCNLFCCRCLLYCQGDEFSKGTIYHRHRRRARRSRCQVRTVNF